MLSGVQILTGAVRGENMNAQEIIEKAKALLPCGFHYTGALTDEDREVIKKVCRIDCLSVSMDGNHTYRILYGGYN